MTTTKSCPACHKEIKADSTTCAYCGTVLVALLPSRTTSHIQPPPITRQPIPEKVIQITRLYADILVFQVYGYEQPILVRASGGEVTLGRYNPGDLAPSVDLTPYNGSQLGVSRKHAIIIRQESGYVVKDIGSTNGTWLNDGRLIPDEIYPLQPGDLLRLGQINLNVYFRLPDTISPTETIIKLKNEFSGASPIRLTPDDLQHQLSPFLKAMADLQSNIETRLNEISTPILIGEITVDSAKSVFEIRLAGGAQALRLLKGTGARWREANLEKIITIHAKRSTMISATSPNEQPPEEYIHQLNIELQNSLADLAQEVLNNFTSTTTSAAKQDLKQALITHLQILLFSPLRIIPDDV